MSCSNDPTGESSEHRKREKLSKLIVEWRQVFTQCVEEAETFTREKPSTGLAIAFFAGTLIGSLIRRRS